MKNATTTALIICSGTQQQVHLLGLLKHSYPELITTTATSVIDAQACLENARFNLIFNVELPKNSKAKTNIPSSWQASEQLTAIQQHLATHNTAIIFVANAHHQDHLCELFSMGLHGFITHSELTESRLKHTIEHARAHSQMASQFSTVCQKVRQFAEYDPLTQLRNRQQFDITLHKSLLQADEHSSVGLFIINIERFKVLNEAYGHRTGDKLLIHLADTLISVLTDNEQAFRIGTDEFAIIISQLSYAHLNQLDQRILTKLNSPISINEYNIYLNLHMGAAFFPQHANNAESLLRCADIAIQCAKNLPSNSLSIIADDMQQQYYERFLIEEQLKEAISRQELELHYQPVISAKTGKLVCCEALIRWHHPEKGLVNPDYFISIAEESKQIVAIGKWIIQEAIKQLAKWVSVYSQKLVMAINISPQQLLDRTLVNYLNKHTTQYHIHPSQIELEITETALLKNTPDILETLKSLTQQGYRIALDDFGTGFSSIQHLQAFPINTVKIDRSLVPNHQQDARSLALLKGLVYMLHSLQLAIVIEGVETVENVTLCRSLQVSRLQGCYFGNPVAANEFSQATLGIHRPSQTIASEGDHAY